MTPVESSTVLDRMVDKAGTLYTLPAVAVEVLQLTNHPKVDVQRLKECIENDPALTSRVLRVVNSSLFGLGKKVSDLNQALALLGTKPLKLLVLGFSLPDSLFVGMAGDILRRFWRRTLTKAVAAREISETLWKASGDEAFIAGLLQDVGMLVMLQEFGEPFVKFLDVAFSKAPDVRRLEAKTFGFDHARLSARLLERWGLPANLVAAIGVEHSSPPPAELPMAARNLAQILHLAELLAGLLTENRGDLLPDLLTAAAKYHNLTQSQLAALVDTLQEKVEQLADVLALELPVGADYKDILVQAHSRLSEVAADAAGDLLRADLRTDSASDSESLLAEVQSLSAALREAARPLPNRVFHSADAGLRPNRVSEPSAASAEFAAGAGDHSASRSATALSPPAGEVDPGFVGLIASAVGSCRQSRSALCLLLVEIDHFAELALTRGVGGAQRVAGLLETLCHGIALADAVCRPTSDGRFALILPGCERQAGVEIGNQMLREMRQVSVPLPQEVRPAISLSIGVSAVALPPKNFPPQELIASAQRCLHAAQLSGGNALKSIEIY